MSTVGRANRRFKWLAVFTVATTCVLLPGSSRGASPPAELISVSAGQPSQVHTSKPSISGDGQVVAYTPGLFRDRTQSDQTSLAPAGAPARAAVSRTGCRIVYAVTTTLAVYDRCTSKKAGSWKIDSNEALTDLAISAGGRYVAATGEDSARNPFVIRLDTVTGAIKQVGGASQASLGDEMLTQLVAVSFSQNQGPVALWDPESGRVDPVSLPDGVTDADAALEAMQPSMTPDGRYVAYVVSETASAQTFFQIFVRDIANNHTALVSKDSTGKSGTGSSVMPSISADGTQIAFGTESADLLDPPIRGLYLPPRRESVQLLVARTTSGFFDTVDFDRVSLLPDGEPIPSDEQSTVLSQPVISSSGRWVAFISNRYDLLVGADQRDRPAVDTYVIGRPASVTVDPLDFGQVDVGDKKTLTSTVTNTGISSIIPTTISASAGFAITGGSCAADAWLAPGTSCTLDVTFTPSKTGAQSGTLTLAETGFEAYSTTGKLRGSGAAAPTTTTTPTTISLKIDPQPADFGTVDVGATGAPQTMTVTNTGDGPAVITAATIGGKHAAEFLITSDGCTATTVAPAATCTLMIAFQPDRRGERTAELTVGADAVTATAGLVGTGSSAPRVRLLPDVFRRGDITIAVGTGFKSGETVGLHWEGDAQVINAVAGADGTIQTPIAVSDTSALGLRRLLVVDVPNRYSGLFANGLVVEASMRPPSGADAVAVPYQVLVIRG